MLVVDANVALQWSDAPDGFVGLDREALVAPPLMWSEARSSLHLAVVKRRTGRESARVTLEALEAAPIERRDHPRLGFEAWAVADEMGWGRTYDAEYIALARLLGCRLVTGDARLRRGADRLGIVIGLEELERELQG